MMKYYLLAFMFCLNTVFASAQTKVLNGDMDHDNKITIVDITMLGDILLGREPYEWLTGNITIEAVPYITFSSSAAQTVHMTKSISTMQYSVNGGAWKTLGTSTVTFGGDNGSIRLRAKSATGTATAKDNYSAFVFGNTNEVSCTGDIRTLVNFLDYNNADCSNARFCYLFKECTQLTSAPLLPSTTLATYCYFYMFYGCTGLSKGPDLPATVLTDYCYNGMFRNCSSLASVKMLATDVSATSCVTSWLASVLEGGILIKNPNAKWNWDGVIPAKWSMETNGYKNNGHAYIDLALTSGTKWATCNVGSSKAEAPGGHYAWGELAEKDIYSWSNYKYCNGTGTSVTKYGLFSKYGVVDNITELEATDDVATVTFGSKWKMPSIAELNELVNECTHTTVTINGQKCYKFTSTTNYNFILIPAAGRYEDGVEEIKSANATAFYWSRELYPKSEKVTSFARYLRLGSDLDSGADVSLCRDRSYGKSVRPIME